MSQETTENLGTTSWFGRLWQSFILLGEAMELSEAERLERRISALEAAASKSPD